MGLGFTSPQSGEERVEDDYSEDEYDDDDFEVENKVRTRPSRKSTLWLGLGLGLGCKGARVQGCKGARVEKLELESGSGFTDMLRSQP